MAETPKEGDTVKVHYTGKLQDGSVFDSSEGREPLEFQIGESQVIPGFEDTVVEMEEGQSRTETIPTERAYGERQEERVVQVGRDQFPDDIEPEEGQQLQVQQPDGSSVPVTVTDVSGEEVTLDANHPLAGEDLTFEIELVEIEKE